MYGDGRGRGSGDLGRNGRGRGNGELGRKDKLEWNGSDAADSQQQSSLSNDSGSISNENNDVKEKVVASSSKNKKKTSKAKVPNPEYILDEGHQGVRSEDDDDDENESVSDSEASESDSVLQREIEFTPTDESDFVSVQYGEPTPLYRAIEDEDWSSILTFLRTDEWGWKCNMFCDSYYNLNEKGAAAQTRTWVGTTDEEGEICRLPLHAAIVRQAPFQVIHTLVKLYRKGAQYPDSDGNFPLHLAFHVGAPLRILVLLLKEYPAAINKKNAEDCLPDECGMGNEIGDVLRMCIEETRAAVTKQVIREKKPMEDERKQLIEVTAELMQLKKLVSERERNVAKENFLFQRNQLSGAISELTRLKLDLEKHEESLLKHSLDEERKRTEEVVSELLNTKKELENVRDAQKKIRGKFERNRSGASVSSDKHSGSGKGNPKKKSIRLLRKTSKKDDKASKKLDENKNLFATAATDNEKLFDIEKEAKLKEEKAAAAETEKNVKENRGKDGKKEDKPSRTKEKTPKNKKEETIRRTGSKPKETIRKTGSKSKDDSNIPRNLSKEEEQQKVDADPEGSKKDPDVRPTEIVQDVSGDITTPSEKEKREGNQQVGESPTANSHQPSANIDMDTSQRESVKGIRSQESIDGAHGSRIRKIYSNNVKKGFGNGKRLIKKGFMGTKLKFRRGAGEDSIGSTTPVE